ADYLLDSMKVPLSHPHPPVSYNNQAVPAATKCLKNLPSLTIVAGSFIAVDRARHVNYPHRKQASVVPAAGYHHHPYPAESVGLPVISRAGLGYCPGSGPHLSTAPVADAGARTLYSVQPAGPPGRAGRTGGAERYRAGCLSETGYFL